ncbi:MAG: DUF5010 C-terminal domain-containing protein [Colwellia sp.]
MKLLLKMLLVVIVGLLFLNCARDLEAINVNYLSSDDVSDTPVENASPEMLAELTQEIEAAKLEFESYSGVEAARCKAKNDLVAKIHSIKPMKVGLELAYENSEEDTELAVAVSDATDLLVEYEAYEKQIPIIAVCLDAEANNSSSTSTNPNVSSRDEGSSTEPESSDDGKVVKWVLTLEAEDNGSVVDYQQNVKEGESFAIDAAPRSKYEFDKWMVTSGSATIANANKSSTTIQLESDATLTATFKAKEDEDPDPDPVDTVPAKNVKIEFEDWATGSSIGKIEYQPENSNIGFVSGGEVLKYENITLGAGNYDVKVRYATWDTNQKSLSLTFNNVAIGSITQTNMTGGWAEDFTSYSSDSWGTISVGSGAENKVLSIKIDQSNINLDWIEFTPK